ncbi:MAG: CBS domain-containing protein [Deltaproteobacteria bacterium]|nr:CBS domain-containing protein [Deltaproteobacteria bacterium]
MGEQNVEELQDRDELRRFTQRVLDDLDTLERICADGLIEGGIRRIGAEQEMFLVDRAGRPAMLAPEVLSALDDERFTTELGRFNIEANLAPHVFGGDCLRKLETELRELHLKARRAAESKDSQAVLVGILPTIEQRHLTLDAMTPVPRYYALNRAMTTLAGGKFRTAIKGMDELDFEHDNIMLEACNTSFQIHFQTAAHEFAKLYNLAQLVTAPVLAVAANSALLLGRRLWHETRIALFQQSVDVRNPSQKGRGHRTRVRFGENWLKGGVEDLFREDLARFRIVLSTELGEPSSELYARGVLPPLTALCLFNGTVYRWNRPCYGVKDNVAHIRIENRALPAGPTVVDEVANSAFFFGLMSALSEEMDDPAEVFPFDYARSNFVAAARSGLDAQFHWLDDRILTAQELVLELIPKARKGLLDQGIDSADVDKYLGILEERTKLRRTGARWMLESLETMDEGTTDQRGRALVKALESRQLMGKPIHTWELAEGPKDEDWIESCRSIGQIMAREPITVHPEDVIDLAASMMDWESIRHMPVEDDDGNLVGVVSHRSLLRALSRRRQGDDPPAIRDVMNPDPVTVTPETTTLQGIRLMKEKRVGCLPVTNAEGALVGIVTETDFLNIAGRMLEERLAADD